MTAVGNDPAGGGDPREVARTAIVAALAALELEWDRHGDIFAVTLPGTRKLTTACALELGAHALSVRAFVARHPDENQEGVYRWLLQRNLRLSYVAFSLDALGDIHLTGRIALSQVNVDVVDQILGVVAATADDSFNAIIELGFADSIRREWAWRRSRGESTANLAAFTQLDPERTEAL